MRPLLAPVYLDEFHCIGSACEDTCCARWNIAIDKATYQTYRKVRDPQMAEKLDSAIKQNRKSNDDSNYAQFMLDEHQNCSMLLEDGLCSIHKELGEAFLCNTCAIYPRHLVQVGHSVEKSLTLSCPEAARVVLLREEGIDFVETEEPLSTRGLMNKVLRLEEYPHFWDLRIFTIQLLQSRQQPIEIRLIILGLFIQKLESFELDGLEHLLPKLMEDYLSRLDNEEFIASLKNIEGNLYFQLNLARELIHYRMTGGMSSQRYMSTFEQLLDGLALRVDEQSNVQNIEKSITHYREAQKYYYEPFIAQHGYMLENYLVNYVFKNLFPYDSNSLFESYMMMVIHFTLVKLHMIGVAAKQKQLTPAMTIACIQQLAKEIEHNSTYLQGVREGMEASGYTTMGHMFVLISE